MQNPQKQTKKKGKISHELVDLTAAFFKCSGDEYEQLMFIKLLSWLQDQKEKLLKKSNVKLVIKYLQKEKIHSTSKQIGIQRFFCRKQEIAEKISAEKKLSQISADDREHVENLRKRFENAKEVEFDGLFLVFEENKFSNCHRLVLNDPDQEIILKTPFLLNLEVTMEIKESKCMEKYHQMCLQFLALSMCSRFLFDELYDAFEMYRYFHKEFKIYSLLVSDGVENDRYSNFNKYRVYQSKELKSIFELPTDIMPNEVWIRNKKQNKEIAVRENEDFFIQHMYYMCPFSTDVMTKSIRELKTTTDEINTNVEVLNKNVKRMEKKFDNKFVGMEKKFDRHQNLLKGLALILAESINNPDTKKKIEDLFKQSDDTDMKENVEEEKPL